MPSAKTKKKPNSNKGSLTAQRETASGAIEQNIVKALAHPLRVRILTVLNDRVASPNELRKLLEEGLSQVSYHVKVLKDFEMIEMVKAEPRRGRSSTSTERQTRSLYPVGALCCWSSRR